MINQQNRKEALVATISGIGVRAVGILSTMAFSALVLSRGGSGEFGDFTYWYSMILIVSTIFRAGLENRIAELANIGATEEVFGILFFLLITSSTASIIFALYFFSGSAFSTAVSLCSTTLLWLLSSYYRGKGSSNRALLTQEVAVSIVRLSLYGMSGDFLSLLDLHAISCLVILFFFFPIKLLSYLRYFSRIKSYLNLVGRSIVSYGASFWISSVVFIIFGNIDIIIFGIHYSSQSLGEYSIVKRICTSLLLVSSVVHVFYSKVVLDAKARSEKVKYREAVILQSLISGIAVLVILLAEPLILKIWPGLSVAAIDFIFIGVLILLIHNFVGPVGTLYASYGKGRQLLIVQIATLFAFIFMTMFISEITIWNAAYIYFLMLFVQQAILLSWGAKWLKYLL